MPYFTNYPNVDYRFGQEEFTVKFPHLSAYSDLLDSVKQNRSFYSNYTIKRGERPDHTSQKLYGDPSYHWTFYLLNNKIRESGWPVDQQVLDVLIKDNHPNTVIVTREEIFDKFLVGTEVEGGLSNARGTIIKRNVDLGQIFIEGEHTFIAGEQVLTIENGGEDSLIVTSTSPESLATSYFLDANGNGVDIDPTAERSNLLTNVTYNEVYTNRNEKLRDIRVIKPGSIREIAKEFERAMST